MRAAILGGGGKHVPLKELRNIATWLGEAAPHEIERVDTLPGPSFRAAGRQQVSFSSNNYLALAASRRMVAAARGGLERYGVANCESRLLGGNLAIYDALEEKLAALKHKDSAVLFATGYLTNLGVLSSLPRSGQYARIYGYRAQGKHSYAYFGDQFNHLSIREGIRMSGADHAIYRHGDLDHLESLLRKTEADSRIIVTDGVFSQDGDIADLPGLLALAERYDAMVYVDDAHGTGVLGETGAGTSEHFGVDSPRLIQMGTLSKAYGAIGGFVATDAHVAQILRLSCAAYGFTSTLPPDQAIAVSTAIDAVCDEPERRYWLWENQRYFVSRMQDLPYGLVSTQTPIVPIMVGEEALADRFAALVKAEGLHVDAVKFPAVAMGKARLRVQLNAGHSRAQIDHLVDILDENQYLLGGENAQARDRRLATMSQTMPLAAAAFSPLASAAAALSGTCAWAKKRGSAGLRWLLRLLGLSGSDLGLALNLVTVATAILIAIDVSADVPHLIYAYLLPIAFIAVRFGRSQALAATAICMLCASVFLFEPVLSPYVEDRQDLADLVAVSVLGALVATFGARSRRLVWDPT